MNDNGVWLAGGGGGRSAIQRNNNDIVTAGGGGGGGALIQPNSPNYDYQVNTKRCIQEEGQANKLIHATNSHKHTPHLAKRT